MDRSVTILSAGNARQSVCARGFTLIELLVVIGIIVLLIGIMIPASSAIRTSAKRSATSQLLASIGSGLETYYNDFSMYPPSNNATVSPVTGATSLAQGLVGYLDYSGDGAGPSNSDGSYGFRVTPSGRGRVYGPYFAVDAKTWKVNSANDQRITDTFGNEIIYYRATDRKTLPTPTNVFGSPSDSYFVENHNPGSPSTSSSTKFWAGLGVTSNVAATGTVSGRDSYLLLSPGPDFINFTDDDVMQVRP